MSLWISVEIEDVGASLEKTKIHVIHVSGPRMMAQGTDGLSRGEMLEGVLGRELNFKHIPLHSSAVQLSSTLVAWIKLWLGEEATFLNNEDWCDRGHGIDGGTLTGDG